MPNDDLGTFPMPPQTSASPVADPIDPVVPQTPSEPQPEPAVPPATPTNTPFEETPDEIPSIAQTNPQVETQPEPVISPVIPESTAPVEPSLDIINEEEKLVEANEDLINKQSSQEFFPPVSQPEPQPAPDQPQVAAESPATLPTKSGNSIAPIIIVVLLIIAGLGLASAAFLSIQTNKLKTQLNEVKDTIEKQKTTLTPTPSPSIYEIPTPSISPNATNSATPSATPTLSISNTLEPLGNAPAALKIAINRSPNAQLILIKVDNVTDSTTAVTKYFFREDLSTKKYFYVAVSGNNIPEIIDKQIYVTPDDNIPSLNDTVLTNKMGIDLSETLKLTYAQCANQTVCTAAPAKAQYIKTGTGIIWQLSLYTKGLSATPLMIQINAETKAILYQSPEFANK